MPPVNPNSPHAVTPGGLAAGANASAVRAARDVADAMAGFAGVLTSTLSPRLRHVTDQVARTLAPALDVLHRGLSGVASAVTTVGNAVLALGRVSLPFAAVGAAAADAVRAVQSLVQAGRAVGSLFGPVLTPAFNLFGRAVAAAVAPLRSAASGLGAALGPAGDAIGRLAAAAGPLVARLAGVASSVGGAVASFAAAFAGAGGAFVTVAQSVLGAVAKANPGVAMLAERAIEDLVAVIGRALAPVLEVATEGIRILADSLSPLAGIGAAVAQVLRPGLEIFRGAAELFSGLLAKVGGAVAALAPAVSAVVRVFSAVSDAVGPALTFLVDVVGGALTEAMKLVSQAVVAAAPYFVAFAKVLGDVVSFVVRGVKDLLALVGVTLPETAGAFKPNSSVGAAARAASFGGVEDVLKRAQASSYSLGSAAVKPEVKTANAAEEIRKRADEIYREIRQFPERFRHWIVEELPAELAKLLATFKQGATAAVNRGVEGAAGAVTQAAGSNVAGGAAAGLLELAVANSLRQAIRLLP